MRANKTDSSITHGWIFSPIEDTAVFLGPIILAAMLLGLYSALGFSLSISGTPMWALAFFFILIDIPHVYTTLFRTYLEPEVIKERQTLLKLAPIVCFVFATSLYLYSDQVFWQGVTYFAVFHFVRQIYGWVMWSAAKGGEFSSLDRRLNQLTAYTITLFPLLWLFTHDTGAMWYSENDFPKILPSAVGEIAHLLYFTILGVYFLRQLLHALKGHGVNLPKNMILLVSALIWYLPMVGLVERKLFIVGVALQTLSHGIPYIHLTYKYGWTRWRRDRGFRGKLFTPLGMVLSYLCFVVIAGAESLGETAEETSALSHWQKALILGLVVTPQLMHYLLDGFIWKTSRDPFLRKTLNQMGLQPR